MNLIETKAKFFDIQRIIEQKDVELKQLVELRQNVVSEIINLEKLEAEKTEAEKTEAE